MIDSVCCLVAADAFILYDIMDKSNVFTKSKENPKTVEAFLEYYELSSLLFNRNGIEVYEVADIPASSKFNKLAKSAAKKLGITWKNMSHEDSNRIMLYLLEDTFNAMREIEDVRQITIELKISK